ncbi:MAG: PKD domain-containing protein [Dehalococcoidia bacterium]|nr:PKD domain-containing protein [Dehalococcoidia bacterium]
MSLLVWTGCSGGSKDDSKNATPTSTPATSATPAPSSTPPSTPVSISTPTATTQTPAKLVAVIGDIRPNPAQANADVTFEGSGERGEIKSYRWSIQGSGAIAYSASFTSSSVTEKPGTYVITLEVQDANGLWSPKAERVLTVLPIPPKPDFTCPSRYGKAPFTVEFHGAASREVAIWAWDFGDGSSSDQQNPSHTYAKGGIYTVSLTTSNEGVSATETKPDLIGAVEVDYVTSIVRDYAPLEINFTNLSKGVTSGWKWDFGDGRTSSEKDPTHTYDNPGAYAVTLKVTVPTGEEFSTAEPIYIRVLSHVPAAEFSYGPTVGLYVPLRFTDLSTGDITSWSWNFGDGYTSSEQNPSHTYGSPGTYSVTLSVMGPLGSDYRQKSITIDN